MKSMKHLFLFLLPLFTIQLAFSQSGVKINSGEFPGKSTPFIYIGGGASMLKTRHETAKNSISNVRLVVFTPAISFNRWSLGLDVIGNYMYGNAKNPAVTAIDTQNATEPDVRYENSGKSSGFAIGGGPSAIFPIMDKFILKPSFDFLYSSFKQANQTVTQHYTYGDITTDLALYSSTLNPANGLGILPQLSLTYQFGLIGIWLEGNYLLGPEMTSTITILEGAGVDTKGNFSKGEKVTTTSETKLNGFGVNAGVSINIGSVGSVRTRGGAILSTDSRGSGRTKGRATLSEIQTTDNNNSTSINLNPPIPAQAQDFNTTRSNRENRFSTDNSVTGDSTNSTNSANKLKKKDSIPSRLSKTPTTARQTQDKTFGESVASGLQSGASAIGAVAKQGGAVSSSYAAGLQTTDNNNSTFTNPNPPIPVQPAQAQDFNATRLNREYGDFAAGDNEQTLDSNGIVFTSRQLPKENKIQSNCLTVISPANGSHYSTNDKINIIVNSTEKLSGESLIKIYKISNDINYWENKSNLKELTDTDNPVYASYNEEFNPLYKGNNGTSNKSDTKFNPITVKTKQVGKSLSSTLKKDELSEGAYKMIVTNSCGVTSSNFSVTSCDVQLNITNVSDECLGYEKDGFKHKICFTSNYQSPNCNLQFSNAGSGLTVYDISNGNPTSISFTQVSGFPLQTQAQGSATNLSYCIEIVVPTATTDILIALQGDQCPDNQVTVCKPAAEVTLELKSCTCDFCENTLEFDNNYSPTATYNATTSSLTIHQDWWNMNNAYIPVAAKAEIINFTRVVGDECMKCDKEWNQWGNFITGTAGIAVGNFGNATNGVAGNTHHTLYFTNPGSSFDLSISIPQLISLTSCCCDKIKIKIRYTYTFKDKDSEYCKMCSTVFEYSFQRGNCRKIPPVKPNVLTPIKYNK